jgi:Matrixin
MNKRLWEFLGILLLFLTLQISKIFAQQCFIYNGYKWPVNSVTYHINSNLQTPYATQEEYETAIVAAAGSWNSAGSAFEFIRGENVNYDRDTEPDTVYQVGWYVVPNDTAAYTHIIINNSLITKVETYYNQWYQFSTNPGQGQLDIQSTIVHEFGHWLNLADETDFWCSNNVMYYLLDYAQIKRDLTLDDENGIVYIYGQNPITSLIINPFLSRQHYFYDYDPRVLLYSIGADNQGKTKHTVSSNDNNSKKGCNCSKYKLFTTPENNK